MICPRCRTEMNETRTKQRIVFKNPLGHDTILVNIGLYQCTCDEIVMTFQTKDKETMTIDNVIEMLQTTKTLANTTRKKLMT